MYAEESVLLPKIESLCHDKLYESADIIAQCLLSNPSPSFNFLKLYAKILYKRGEYKRAINYYAQAVGLLSLGKSKGSKEEIPLKSLIFTCYYKLKLYEQGVSSLKAISHQQLKTATLLLLARAHRILQNSAEAIACYTELLHRNPLAFEAVIALTQFKQSPNEILTLSIKRLHDVFPSKRNDNAEDQKAAGGKAKGLKPPVKPPRQMLLEEKEKENHNLALASSLRRKFKPFYESFVLAHTCNSNSQYKQSLQYFTQIQSEYKKHLHSLQYLGLCHTRLGSFDQAKYSFEIIRSSDKCYIDSMDTYASLIKKSGNLAELNKLARDILSVDCHRPEPWIAMALYCDLKGQKEEAKLFVDKAVYLSTGKLTSALALVLRGELQLSLDSPTQAIESFKKAYDIEKDYSVFKGIVHAHLGVLRFDEALSYAKEACIKHPNNPHTLSLLAYALMQSPIVDGKAQAKKFLENALKIDPASFDAIMTLVQLFVLELKFPEAIDLLKKHLERENAQADLVYTKLGDIYVKTKNYAEAMIQYHSALNINPNLEKAKSGLKSLEKLLNRLGTSDDSIDLATDEEDSLEINEEAEIEESGSVQEEEDDSFESFM